MTVFIVFLANVIYRVEFSILFFFFCKTAENASNIWRQMLQVLEGHNHYL